MITFPNAKINLGLFITGKRSDGYHNIESVFYPVRWCDVLEVVEGKAGRGNGNEEGLQFTSSGLEIPGDPKSNLIFKAYRLLKQDHALPAMKAHLHKVIPMGAGLGGGSSDAVAFLKLVNEKFELNISWGELNHYAKQLGSDTVFFTANRPSYVSGRGENCEFIPLDLSNHFIVIVHPGIHIVTAEAYAGITPKQAEFSLEKMIGSFPVKEWKEKLSNDFEEPIFKKFPGIKSIKEKMYSLGAIYASMSGSGSAVYGIFEKGTNLGSEFRDCAVWEGRM